MTRNFDLTADMATAPRQESSREEAYDRAIREARRFLSSGGRSYLEVRARLDEVIAEGRRQLKARRVAADDIEAWDTSCRIMFLLRTWRPL
jgi:broad specificity phosphatase PhoE